jgi:hypothetical protein
MWRLYLPALNERFHEVGALGREMLQRKAVEKIRHFVFNMVQSDSPQMTTK